MLGSLLVYCSADGLPSAAWWQRAPASWPQWAPQPLAPISPLSAPCALCAPNQQVLDGVLKEIATALLQADVNVRLVANLR